MGVSADATPVVDIGNSSRRGRAGVRPGRGGADGCGCPACRHEGEAADETPVNAVHFNRTVLIKRTAFIKI
jgi:hypothetical protein